MKTYVGVDFYSSTGKMGLNTIQGSNYGVYCDTYSSPVTWWSGGPPYQMGHNTIQSNLYGLVAYYYSNPMFGDFNLLHGEPIYYGSCNDILNNTTYNAFANTNCSVLAEGNWWGAAPPGQIYTVNNSTIYSGYYGTPSQHCPDGGGGAISAGSETATIVGSTTETTVDDGIHARIRGDYETAKSIFSQVLESSADGVTRERALVGLLEVFRDSKDFSVIQIVETYKASSGNLGLLASEILSTMYSASGRYDEARALASKLMRDNPGTDLEKHSLILLASLAGYTGDQRASAKESYDELVSKYGSSVDKGLLAALGLGPVGEEAIASPAVSSTEESQISISSYPCLIHRQRSALRFPKPRRFH